MTYCLPFHWKLFRYNPRIATQFFENPLFKMRSQFIDSLSYLNSTPHQFPHLKQFSVKHDICQLFENSQIPQHLVIQILHKIPNPIGQMEQLTLYLFFFFIDFGECEQYLFPLINALIHYKISVSFWSIIIELTA